MGMNGTRCSSSTTYAEPAGWTTERADEFGERRSAALPVVSVPREGTTEVDGAAATRSFPARGGTPKDPWAHWPSRTAVRTKMAKSSRRGESRGDRDG